MSTSNPYKVLVTYRPTPGNEEALLALVKKHWPAVHGIGLATDEPATILRLKTRANEVYFVEIFSWRDQKTMKLAHETPEVMAVWEPMGKVLQGGRPDVASVEAVIA